MHNLKQVLLIASLLALPLAQGCAFTPMSPEPQVKQAALERWYRCVQRFYAKAGDYCEGHRRDILVMYPVHLENQISRLLSQDAHSTRASQLLNTAVGYSATDAGDTARNVDM